jgi:hypothetical protein
MSKAIINDGQELLAFNDIYLVEDSHLPPTYKVEFKVGIEQLSCSGIIVSNGAGSTRWLRSVFNMTNNVNTYDNSETGDCETTVSWIDNKLVFLVRESFLNK